MSEPTAPACPTTTQPPRVLFVCVRNGGKSQMAAGLARSAAARHGVALDVSSAGTDAGARLNAESVEALAEVGTDIRDQRPRQLTAQDVREADLVVVLGSEARIDAVEGTEVEVWETDEPSSRGIGGMERMRLVRDDIGARTDALVRRLGG